MHTYTYKCSCTIGVMFICNKINIYLCKNNIYININVCSVFPMWDTSARTFSRTADHQDICVCAILNSAINSCVHHLMQRPGYTPFQKKKKKVCKPNGVVLRGTTPLKEI